MDVGLIGLGKMGGNMATRLLRAGHRVVGHARQQQALDRLTADGGEAARSVEELVAALAPPRVVWLMVPAGDVTQQVLEDVAGRLDPGDVVIDGGNSRWTDTLRRASELERRGLRYVDAGTSGGIWGLQEGYCLMVGAHEDTFATIEPLLRDLAPPQGYARVGRTGAGHFTKMVHNGVEYALMQAYAEGFDLLRASEFDLDLHQIAGLWRRGSVVRSWLLDLAERALAEDPDLEALDAWVSDSGEGRWTVEAAIGLAVPAPTIAAALWERFSSRQDNSFAHRLLAALRNQFGGHAVKPATAPGDAPGPPTGAGA